LSTSGASSDLTGGLPSIAIVQNPHLPALSTLDLKNKQAEADRDFRRSLELDPSLKQVLEERRKKIAEKHLTKP
jgi:hypothetical protein